MTASCPNPSTADDVWRMLCPDWCTGQHLADDVDVDGSLYHPGPSFGVLSFAGTTSRDGSLRALDGETARRMDLQSAADLRQLAADALAAADWLEAQSVSGAIL